MFRSSLLLRAAVLGLVGLLQGWAQQAQPAENEGDGQGLDSVPLGGEQPLNILFIFSDDHATHAVGAYMEHVQSWLAQANERNPLTPNIDRLAGQGAIALNTFCGNSICGPSRASILTGTHSHVNGFVANNGRGRTGFDMSQWTFPAELKRHGYRTALIGKWHLNELAPKEMFDDFMVYQGQGRYSRPFYLTRDGRFDRQGYSVEVTGELAEQWMREHSSDEQPFFLACQFKAPHRNFLPPVEYVNEWGPELVRGADGQWQFSDELPMAPSLEMDVAQRSPSARWHDMGLLRTFRDRDDAFLFAEGAQELPVFLEQMPDVARGVMLESYERRNADYRQALADGFLEGRLQRLRWNQQRYLRQYLGAAKAVDREVGRLMETLEELDLAENTIVVYASDQGFFLGDYGMFDKRWAWDISMRMPFIVRWPGQIEAGLEVEELFQNIDFAPTLLDLAGVEREQYLQDERVQGVSLAPVLLGEQQDLDRDSLYYHYYQGAMSTHAVPRHEAVRTQRWKLLRVYESYPQGGFSEGQEVFWELYDLENDPMELNNLAMGLNEPDADEELLAVFERLQAELVRLREEYEVPPEHYAPIDRSQAAEDGARSKE